MIGYEYVLLRYVPDPAAGELVNFGILMWVPEQWRLLYRVSRRVRRAIDFFPSLLSDHYRATVDLLESRIEHYKSLRVTDSQPELFGVSAEAAFDAILEDVLRVDSTVLQRSPVMSGVTAIPEKRLDQLFREFVRRHEIRRPERERVTEREVVRAVQQGIEKSGLSNRVAKDVLVQGRRYEHRFPIAWTNGKLNVVEPMSFDYADKQAVLDKATHWTGRLVHLREGTTTPFELTAVVAPPSTTALRPAYRDALAMLREQEGVRAVVEVGEVGAALVPTIEADLEAHATETKP